jgi:threonine dehydrogenase-like Zn-dependent dehydrogenase
LGKTGKRLRLDPHGRVHIDDVPVPDIGPNEILVRSTLSQVSAGTEMNDVRKRRAAGANPADFADMGLGYTTVGVVERVGRNVTSFAPGDRVLGQPNHGSFSVVPWDQDWVDKGNVNSPYLEKVPAGLADEEIVFASLGDVALHAVRHGKLQLGESAAVHGLGQIGLLALQLCRINGAHPVIGVDPSPSRRAMAKTLGATTTVDPLAPDAVEQLHEATRIPFAFKDEPSGGLEPGSGVDFQVHTTARLEPLDLMFRAAADRGRIALAGTPSAWPERGPRANVGVDEFLRREVMLVGSYETGMTRPHPYWPWSRARNRAVILDLIGRGQLNVRPLISHVVPYTRAPEMYDLMQAGTEGWMGRGVSRARRQIRLTIVESGESVVADLLDDEAPRTAEHVWGLLPVESQLIHGQFSGAEVFVLIEPPVQLPAENLVQLPLPGELLYFYEGTESATSFGGAPASEIAFIYNRGVTLRQAEGVPTHLNLFARVPGDWKTEWTAFRAACRKARSDRLGLRIERA